MNAFDAIVDAFVAKLEALPALADNIERAGTRPVPAEADTSINVFFDGALPNVGVIKGFPIDWMSRIAVQLYARSSTTTGDVAISQLVAKVFARLAEDSTLGGRVDDIGTPNIDPVYDSQGQRTGFIRLTYSVLHRTSNNTIA